MLDVLGVFFVLKILRTLFGIDSPEKDAAKAIADVHQAAAEHAAAAAQTAAAAAAMAAPAAAPAAAATAPVTATAVAPSGAPVTLPATTATPQGAASPAVQPAPFPAAKPDLPPFPAGWAGGQPPGWEYAEDSKHHVSPAIVARAQALLPQLWATGAGTHTQEMTGGVWVTYNAESHSAGKKGVTAYWPKGTKAAAA
jgi:hypothetical protein